MQILRRAAVIVAMIVMLATAIEYGLVIPAPQSVAEGIGPHIN